jgi:hypothetical protein
MPLLFVYLDELLTQNCGELLPNTWQDVTQKVGREVSHFLLTY